MFGRLDSATKILLRRAGIDIRRSKHLFMHRLVRLLQSANIDLVVDVGANVGQFGSQLYACGYQGRLLSFEPFPEAWQTLKENARRANVDWIVAEPVALSDRSGEASLNISTASATNSLLDIRRDAGNIVGGLEKIGTVPVRLATLDEELRSYFADIPPMAIKIDTQGSELAVLNGTAEIWEHVGLAMVECSIGTLYEEQPAYHELDAELRGRGMMLADTENGFRDPRTGRLLEFDAVYARR